MIFGTNFFFGCLRSLQEMDHATLITSTGLSSCTLVMPRIMVGVFVGFGIGGLQVDLDIFDVICCIYLYIGAYTTELYSDLLLTIVSWIPTNQL